MNKKRSKMSVIIGAIYIYKLKWNKIDYILEKTIYKII